MRKQDDELSKMRRDDLLAYAKEEYNITHFPNAKDPETPIKREIIEEIKREEKQIDSFMNTKPAGSEQPVKKKKKRKTARELKQELLALKRVIVTELRKPMNFQNDDSNRVEFITWGNEVVGTHTNRVVFNTPWMLPVGCIRNLENVMYSPIDNKRSTVPRALPPTRAYKIEYLDLPSEQELKQIAERQKLREAQGV